MSGLWSTSGSCSALASEFCGYTNGYDPILNYSCEFPRRISLRFLLHFGLP